MLRKLTNLVLDLLFPRQCVGCKQADTWLCQKCFNLISPKKFQSCYICQKPSRYGDTCDKHKNSPRQLDRLLISCHYSGNPLLKKAIKNLKYHLHPEDISEKLGKILSQTLNKNLTIPNRDLVLIPVPLHKKRLKERGFNQADLLLHEISRYQQPANLPAGRQASNQLTRTKHTVSQVKSKSRQKRLENLKDAFTVNQKLSPHKTYILVDDIATTGSTLEECCQALKTNGARNVWGLVIARN